MGDKQAIQIYSGQDSCETFWTCRIPLRICDEINRLLRNFIWGPLLNLKEAPLSIGTPSGNLSYWVSLLRQKYRILKPCVGIWPSFHNFLLWSIGDGTRIQFWYDSWIPKLGPLVHWKLDRIDAIDDLKVSHFVQLGGSWNWAVLRQLLHLYALDHLLNLPVPNFAVGPDRCAWEPGKHGEFSVKSSYTILSKDTGDPKDRRYDLIWQLKLPLLQHHHLSSFHTLGLVDWILLNIDTRPLLSGTNIPWSIFFSSLIWKIWKRRNSHIFAATTVSNANLLHVSRTWAVQCHSSLSPSASNLIPSQSPILHWSPAPSGWLTLNIDGSVSTSPPMAQLVV
ncbi:hypothetical protein V6N11_063214 [Hibiscus sabdariffa]|uniref:Reverse transcriptase zinc-binding domain-containing protein n=1 Tax=Hibiscus sabdariffa TaxID=183260 RepID=A0ABR2NWX3_9ROSI